MDDDNLDFDASVYDKPLSLSWKPRDSARRTFAKASFGQKLRAAETISKSRRVGAGDVSRALDSQSSGSSSISHRPSPPNETYQNHDEASSGARTDIAASQSSFSTQNSQLLPESSTLSEAHSQSVDKNPLSWATSEPGDDNGYRNIFAEPAPRRNDTVSRKAPPHPSNRRSNGRLLDSAPETMQSPQSSSASSITHSTKATTRSRDWPTTQNGSSRKRPRQEHHRRRSGWLSDDESPSRDTRTNTAVAEAFSSSGATIYRHPTARVAGVRVDAYAAADAGSTQFFRDEVLWCCSNIVGSNQKDRLQAATDLAILISDTSTYPVDSVVHDDVLRALIQMLSFCKELVIDEESNHNTSESKDSASEVKRFVVMVLHYLAMFCCDERYKRTRSRLHSNNSAHRAVRKSLLSSTDVLQGIVCLVLTDPRVAQIRGKKRRVSSLLGSNLEEVQGSPAEADGSQSTVASSVATTPDSVASSQAACAASATTANAINDPTRAGRLRRVEKRRANGTSQLSPILEAKPRAKKALAFDETDELSFVGSGNGSHGSGGADNLSYKDDSSCAVQDKPQKKLSALMKRVSRTVECSLIEHACGTESDVWAESIPLLALSRIMTGRLDGNLHSASASTSSEKEIATFSTLREEDEEAVIRDERLTGGSGVRFWEGTVGVNEPESEAEDSAVHAGNRNLAEAGIVSLLATAVADTLSAVARLLIRDCRKGRRPKPVCCGCVSHLCERLRMLVSIVDASCLFCDENRVTFCQGGHSDELGGYLIVGLVSVLGSFCDAGHKMFAGVWGDIVLETLRALLTLTHENKVAARELEVVLSKRGESGLGVISMVLHTSSIGTEADSGDNKHKYDCSIFCLNILTNYLESGGSCDNLAEIQVTNGILKGGSVPRPFLSWLAAWLVGQTSTFRDAVMESTFGSSPSKHSSRTLQGNEDEKLVMAGNGFVLLAWMLVGDDSSRPSKSKIRETIEAELPGSDPATKRTYLRNTLKAFCNFYHASVGDMSVVIVDPVKKLIRKLESDA